MNYFNSNLEKINDEKNRSEKDKSYNINNNFSSSNNDDLNEQIFSLSHTSQNRQKMMFQRKKK